MGVGEALLAADLNTDLATTLGFVSLPKSPHHRENHHHPQNQYKHSSLVTIATTTTTTRPPITKPIVTTPASPLIMEVVYIFLAYITYSCKSFVLLVIIYTRKKNPSLCL